MLNRSLRDRSQPGAERRLGSAIVETAFVLPIFFTVVLGIVEFGRAFMVSNLLTNAAREGARLAIIPGVTGTEVRNAVRQQVFNMVNVTLTDAQIPITITPYPGNPNPNNEPANANQRDLIVVEASLPYAQVSYVIKFLNGVNLRGQAAMRHE